MLARAVVTGALVAAVLFGSPGMTQAGGPGGAIHASVTADPLRLGLALTTVGTTIKARGTATDLGRVAFLDVVVTLRVPKGIVVSGTARRDLGLIGAGKTASTTWTLCASAPGNYLLILTGTAKDANGRTWTAVADAVALTVTTSSKRCH